MRAKPFYKQLYFWVLVGMALGVAAGALFPKLKPGEIGFSATVFKPLSEAFIRLIRMVIAPVIFSTVVLGVAGMGNLRRVGRLGLKAFVYFEAMTTLALVIGWIVAQVFHPGTGMDIDPTRLNTEELKPKLDQAPTHADPVKFLLNIIPRTFVGAFADGDLLQVLFVSVLFGIALGGVGESARPFLRGLEQVSKALIRMIGMIINFAPFAVFGAMSYAVAEVGMDSLLGLAKFLACVILSCVFFITVCLGFLLWINRVSLWRFLRYIRHEIFIVFSAASSEPVLPRMIAKLEHLGCSRPVVGLVLPSGYSFNLDGSSIYFTMGALFIAQATNCHLTFAQELQVLVICLITSKGAAAVVGSAFITLTATLISLKTIPVEGMVLVLGVDWFLAQARSMTNLVGNGVATIVMARWENEFDSERAARVLNGEIPFDEATHAAESAAAEPTPGELAPK